MISVEDKGVYLAFSLGVGLNKNCLKNNFSLQVCDRLDQKDSDSSKDPLLMMTQVVLKWSFLYYLL